MGNATIKYQKQSIFLRNIQNTFCLTRQKTDERPRTAAEKIIAEKTGKILDFPAGPVIIGAENNAERPANESQVGISRFQVRKKATRNQTAERSKIETAVGQRGVQYEIRSAPVCLDKQLPRRSRYAGTCWQKPSCRPCRAFLRNAFCP